MAVALRLEIDASIMYETLSCFIGIHDLELTKLVAFPLIPSYQSALLRNSHHSRTLMRVVLK